MRGDSMASLFMETLNKYNPYHDRLGRFATANEATSFSIPKDPKLRDKLIERERQRTEAMAAAEAAAKMPKIDKKTAAKYAAILNKSNKKEINKAYAEDEDFATLADTISLYTQGDYKTVRQIQEDLVDGKEVKDFQVKDATHPMSTYKAVVTGQDLENSPRSAVKGAALLKATIENAPPEAPSIYRGSYRFNKAEKPAIGSTITIKGAYSYTDSFDIAKRFSEGRASAQPSHLRDVIRQPILYEIKAGSRAINVQALSPYKQREWLTKGTFQVVDVKEIPRQVYRNGMYYEAEPTLHIVLEQKEV